MLSTYLFNFSNISNIYIFFSFAVAKLNSLHPKSQVTVFKLQDPLPLANEVILCCENNECYSNLEKIILRLKMQNMNKIFCNGNKVLIKHFGKTFIFKIINIIPIENTEYLSKECFYLVGPETKLILNNLIQHSNKQENLINKLGGLSEIIEELKDFISFNLNGKNVLSSKYK